MNSGQQLSRILFLPDKLKIITFWLSQYVTLLLCHMALDAETQHQVTPKLEGWNTGESRVSIWKDLNKPEKQPSQNLMRFNKAKWSCALGSEVLHVPGQPEGWANSPTAAVWGSHNNSCSQPGETPGKGCRGNKGTTAPEVQREAEATALLRLETRSPRQDVAAVFHYLNPLEKTDIDISQGCMAKEQKATVTSCNKGNTNWEGKIFISVGLEHHWNRSPKGLFSHHPWRFSKLLKA